MLRQCAHKRGARLLCILLHTIHVGCACKDSQQLSEYYEVDICNPASDSMDVSNQTSTSNGAWIRPPPESNEGMPSAPPEYEFPDGMLNLADDERDMIVKPETEEERNRLEPGTMRTAVTKKYRKNINALKEGEIMFDCRRTEDNWYSGALHRNKCPLSLTWEGRKQRIKKCWGKAGGYILGTVVMPMTGLAGLVMIPGGPLLACGATVAGSRDGPARFLGVGLRTIKDIKGRTKKVLRFVGCDIDKKTRCTYDKCVHVEVYAVDKLSGWYNKRVARLTRKRELAEERANTGESRIHQWWRMRYRPSAPPPPYREVVAARGAETVRD